MATASIVINSGTPGQAVTDLPISVAATLANADNTGVDTWEWVIVSQPEGAPQVDLNPHEITNPIVSTDPTCSLTPIKEGSYLIRLTVNVGLADESVATTICAVRELQTGDRIPAPQETTEVNADEGWAPGAVTKILQRVTRLSDAGIFVALNNSGGSLSPGEVVHMNGMSTLGVGDNERTVPTVGKALATDLATVDGPLGVMVGQTNGGYLPVADGDLCRVMVIGALAEHPLQTGYAAGDPVFVNNDGALSLIAGDVTRQVGDVARVVTDGVYDIAISAGANSIPRGNAGGDLDGSYPNPIVASIKGVSISNSPTAAGQILRVTSSAIASWGAIHLDDEDSVTATLPVVNGGTGQSSVLLPGSVIYSATSDAMSQTAVGTSGYLLKSNGTAAPSWIQTVPVLNGGTGTNSFVASQLVYAASTTALGQIVAGTADYLLKSNGAGIAPSWLQTVPVANGGTGQGTALLPGAVIYAASATAMNDTAVGTSGNLLLSGGAGAPTWAALNLGTAGINTLTGTLPIGKGGTGAPLVSLTTGGVIYANTSSTMACTAFGFTNQILRGGVGAGPTWENFDTFYLANYAKVGFDTITSFSTSQTVYIPAATASIAGIANGAVVTIELTALTTGAEASNITTTGNNGSSTIVYFQYVVTGPATTKTFVYAMRSPVAHNNNQVTGCVPLPVVKFVATESGTHSVELSIKVNALSNTFDIANYRLFITQG